MYEIFKVCFMAGFILILIAFVIGQFCDFTGIDGLDLSIGDLPIFVPFSPLMLFLFATIFGGVGMLVLTYTARKANLLAVLIGALCAITVCILIKKFVIRPLKKAENTSAAEEEELIGLPARVSEKIPKQGFGEITYVIYGNTYLAPAKSTNGEKIEAGCDVSICWIEQHVFYVAKI